MSSTTRLLVLGVVRNFQPVHGYVVRRELLSWRANEWAQLKTGSIYNALKSLEDEGCLEITGTDREGARPERTTYRITQAGIEAHNKLMRDTWWHVRPVVDPLMAGIAFLSSMPRTEAIAALESRVAQIGNMTTYLAHALDALDADESPEHVREMLKLSEARTAAELAWARAFKKRLEAGDYRTAEDPPWAPASVRAARKPRKKPAKKKRA